MTTDEVFHSGGFNDQSTTTAKIAEPIHLTISLNAKGRIQFEVSIHAATEEETARLTFALVERVRMQYAGKMAGEEMG